MASTESVMRALIILLFSVISLGVTLAEAVELSSDVNDSESHPFSDGTIPSSRQFPCACTNVSPVAWMFILALFVWMSIVVLFHNPLIQ